MIGNKPFQFSLSLSLTVFEITEADAQHRIHNQNLLPGFALFKAVMKNLAVI